MPIRLKYFLIIFSALSVLLFLYVKTNTINFNEHNQVLNDFNQFMIIDSELNQNILEIRQGLLSFYDPIVGRVTRLKAITSDIENLLQTSHTNHNANFTPLLNNLSETLETKKNAIENFKSTNAIFTNSLRYLPIATQQLSAKLPLDSQGDVVTQLLTEQLRDILIHNYSNDNIILDKFNKTNKLLKSIFENSYKPFLSELNSLQSHAEIVISNKILIDNIVSDIIATPSSINLNHLINEYLALHNKKITSIKQYQKTLYGLSVLLLAYLIYILYKLNISRKKLKETVKDLNYQKFAMDQHAIVSVTDEQGIISYANQKFCAISGYTPNEIMGKTHAILKSKNHPKSFFKKSIVQNESGESWHGIIRNKNKNNENYWVETTCVPFINEKGMIYKIVTIQTDITEIKNAQKKLKLQSAALEVAANGIVITDKNAKILWSNKAFSEMTGYTFEESLHESLNLLDSGKQNSDFYTDMWETIIDGRPWHGELINRRKDASLYPEELTISPVKNSAEEITHFISIKQDISQRNITEEALRRSQKMDAIGQLSGGIAHDFNNQLGIALGYLDFLKEDTSNNESTAKYIDTALKATQRCVELTRQLLAFSRNQTIETSTLNINELLNEQALIITRTVTPIIEVNFLLFEPLWKTQSNVGEFQDAILNMILNARDAMPDGGTLTIKTHNSTINNDQKNNQTMPMAGDYIVIALIDTGTGMDKKTLENIFDPFYTTKSIDKGTGLGMSMVYGYVKRSKGFINIDSQVDAGTTISIYLPRSI